MFGLPYANPTDPELVETMQYLDSLSPAAPPKASTTTHVSPEKPVARGREYYENLCMRAVNQSIGTRRVLSGLYGDTPCAGGLLHSGIWCAGSEGLQNVTKRPHAASLSAQRLPAPLNGGGGHVGAWHALAGRAIRHRNDYAAILLVDERWTRSEPSHGEFNCVCAFPVATTFAHCFQPRLAKAHCHACFHLRPRGCMYAGINPPIDRLPNWIKSSIQPSKSFGQSYVKVLNFFKNRQPAQ